MANTQTLKAESTQEKIYPNAPKNLTIAYNLVVNSNGQQFGGNQSRYNWFTIEDSPWTSQGYTVRQFRYGDDFVSDISVIQNYLKFMTGSDYIPEYNANQPNDEFIFLNADSTTYKYQYVEGYGLLAFLVTNFPFALKSDLQKNAKIKQLGVWGEYNESDSSERFHIEVTFPCVIKFSVQGQNNPQTITVFGEDGEYEYFLEGNGTYIDYVYISTGIITLGHSNAEYGSSHLLYGVVISK